MAQQHIKKYIEKQVSKNLSFKKVSIRFALPFNVQCNNCKHIISKNTRFNAHKETLLENTFCGVDSCRFSFKCKNCYSKISLLSDPENERYKTDENCLEISDQIIKHKNDSRDWKILNESNKSNIEKHELFKNLKLKAQKLINSDVDTAIRALSTGKPCNRLKEINFLKN